MPWREVSPMDQRQEFIRLFQQPLLAVDGALHVIDSIGEGLVRANFETGQVLPGLAESWKVSDDGLDYVFNIRKGMVFQDGALITAQAIVRSMMRSTLKTSLATLAQRRLPALSVRQLLSLLSLVSTHRATGPLSR